MTRRYVVLALALLGLVLIGPSPVLAQQAGWSQRVVIDGRIAAATNDRGDFLVTLYRLGGEGMWGSRAVLARTASVASGSFRLVFRDRSRGEHGLLVAARRGVLLYAAVLPPGAEPSRVVLNELSTVAAAFSLAQFISPRGVAGYEIGIRNGTMMAGNFVDPATGAIAAVLASEPNGPANSTVGRLNALANILAGCARQRTACNRLFLEASGERGRPPFQTLQAMVEIAKNPWRNIDEIFALSQIAMPPYSPALRNPPSGWTLPLVLDGVNKGSGTINVLNGPGNFAFDAEGNANVGINYQPSPGPDQENVPVCAGTVFVRLAPDGSFAPGSPFSGGGLDGVGFGITLDPKGRVWLTNFGFAGDGCPFVPSSDSVSLFTKDGVPLSGANGITEGELSWPQGIASTREGDIWIASCLNGNITTYPRGDPRRARVVPPAVTGLEKPFAVAVDPKGRIWITGNKSSSVAILDRHGRPLPFSPLAGEAFDLPLGIASDSKGRIWVASSVVLEAPCPDGNALPEIEPGSLTLIHQDGRIDPRGRFEGGGLSIPWGVAIDGRDNVWVANFGSNGAGAEDYVGRISQFCGAEPRNCPPGFRTGAPISPATGYASEALQRITAVAVDPTGNVWATNNWSAAAPQTDPGGTSVVVFPGIAAPVRTPLIGPVRSAVQEPWWRGRGTFNQGYGR